ncbi:MAG TPA: TRAP transporter small permease subunit [Rhodospirillales bacterium]|nr:TRAP transporter small permease subunit [Rhodospirillales bacterium]
MPEAVKAYVRFVDAFNRRVGRGAMYMIFVMMGILLLSSLSRGLLGISYVWVVEMSQFLLTAYYILGGPYSVQLDGHVRMDVFYSRWSPKTRAVMDACTSFFVLFYLVVLLMGAISSTKYAIQYGQKNYSAWAPPLWPIKVVMTFGILLMLLQMLAVFFRDLAKARGETIE